MWKMGTFHDPWKCLKLRFFVKGLSFSQFLLNHFLYQAIDKHNKLTEINGILSLKQLWFRQQTSQQIVVLGRKKGSFFQQKTWSHQKSQDLSQRVPLRGYGYSKLVGSFFQTSRRCGGFTSGTCLNHTGTISIIATESIQELVERNAVDDHAIGGKKCSWWSKPGFMHMFPRIYPLSPKSKVN